MVCNFAVSRLTEVTPRDEKPLQVSAANLRVSLGTAALESVGEEEG